MLVWTGFVDLETIEPMGTKFLKHISGNPGSANSFVFQSIYTLLQYMNMVWVML